jgi:hypothetical protein
MPTAPPPPKPAPVAPAPAPSAAAPVAVDEGAPTDDKKGFWGSLFKRKK